MTNPGQWSYDDVTEAASVIAERLDLQAEVGIILGSGLGAVADAIADPRALACDEIPHWPLTRVAGHDNRLIAGKVAGRPVVVVAGRPHYYEGHAPEAVIFPTRVLAALGVRTLILTSAAGGIREELRPGDLVVVDDHVNLMGMNPLRGPDDPRVGPRFPDMSDVYTARLRALADDASRDLDVGLHHGVYAAVTGPSYETPAEIRWLRAAGADAVGMSTVPEAIAARHAGLEVLGIACITNPAAGLAAGPLYHDAVLAATRDASARLGRLLAAIIGRF